MNVTHIDTVHHAAERLSSLQTLHKLGSSEGHAIVLDSELTGVSLA